MIVDLLPAQALPQAEHNIINVSIRELCEQRERFNISPEYQREDVWSRRECQQCIDTILRGLGIGLLEGYKYRVGGKTYWEIMDGHQRISAILRFYDNEYKTWSPAIKRRMQPASKLGPVEPAKYYEQCGAHVKDYFLDYHLPISKIPEMPMEERAVRFLAIQCHKPLTSAENLHVHPSKANRAATTISRHPFWEDFYIGVVGRKQLYMSSLYMLALQMTPSGMVDLRSGSFVSALACGQYDEKVTDDLISRVQDRLDIASCIYSGIQFSDRSAAIAMYQSVTFLEQAGCTIQSSTHKGRLASWITSELEASKHVMGVYRRPIQSLLYESGQREFWGRHRKIVFALFDIDV